MLTSLNNHGVKLARSLRNKKKRMESGLFLVEGILHVGEAAEAGWDFETVYYAPELLRSEFAIQLVEDLSRRGVRCLAVAERVFSSMAEKDNPQGILAVVRSRVTKLDDITQDNFYWGVALANPQDPGNLGTIIRTLDAVGADGLVLLDGGVDIYHPSVVRASMGTLFWKRVVTTTFDDFLTWARGNGYKLIGTSASASADYRTVSLDRPTIILLGSEQKGLSEAQLDLCDVQVRLPMRGRASSLNLSVAAGILLYALVGD